MENKLLIVDGHNLLFQMFFGMPARIINKEGIAIQGVLGFVGALNKIIRMIQPTHIVVLFDIEQIIYHVIRCGLVHECNIDQTIKFTNRTIIGDWNNKFYIPQNIIWGLIASVEEGL